MPAMDATPAPRDDGADMTKSRRLVAVCNAVGLILLAGYTFLIPAFLLTRDLTDPAWQSEAVPSIAWRLHRRLAERIARWAPERVRSKRATLLSTHHVADTEWPVFSCVFYLWATEALQLEARKDATFQGPLPAEYAREAVEAAAALVADPGHAEWVRKHWGDDYLKSGNLFYRMLLISGLTSYEKLTGERKYRDLLAGQVESLAAELDRSPHGLLDDYPGQCYPIDILPAIAAIRRADAVLGTDHARFAAQAVRGFQGARLDPRTQLPAYVANAVTGDGSGSARGVGIASELIWAPEVWPETARAWYPAFEKHFWRESAFLAGVREYPAGSGAPDWSAEVDAGPVLAGYGTTASAFAIGAARANGRFDQAGALAAEALVAGWPLPDGTLLGARVLSSVSDAPFVGESILLFVLTRQPAGGGATVSGGGLPLVVPLGVAGYFLLGGFLVWQSGRRLRATFAGPPAVGGMDWQVWTWLALMAAGLAAFVWLHLFVALAFGLMAQFLPREPRG